MNRPFRILQVHNDQAALGGALEVVEHERDLLIEAGHRVDQYVLPAAEKLDLPSWRAGAKAVWNVEASRQVGRLVERDRPDIVHVHTPFPLLSPAVFRTARRAGAPTVTTLHSYRYSCVAGTCVRDSRVCEDCVGSRLKLSGVRHACYHDSRAGTAALTLSLGLHRAIGTFSRDVTRYLTLTDFAKRLLIRDGYPADKILVKPNSVPDPGVEGRARTDVPTVFFAGRLIVLKGVRTLLDAWQRLRPHARLVIAGDGEMRPLVEERAAQDDTIEFVGWIPAESVTDHMRDAALTVVPSEWYEGMPLVISRSLGVGTPVLVSDLENISEDVLADDAGWTFEVGSVESLAGALARLLADVKQLELGRPRARASYERRYSPAMNLSRLESVYAQAAESDEA